MNYDEMTIESLADYCFEKSGCRINRADLENRIQHLCDKYHQDKLNNLSQHLVSDTVIYDNFGRDFKMPKETYKISEVVKDGYLICNVYTKPFFAYGYQLKTYR